MTQHQPVMLDEMMQALKPKGNATYIDATFGRGGYTQKILKDTNCQVLAIDRDPDAIKAAQNLTTQFPKQLKVIHGRFAQINAIAQDAKIGLVDGVVFDLGLSSPQIDTPERGFSFKHDGPLDMRMEKTGPNAQDFINNAPENEIARILWEYGEERAARRIAKAIVKTRTQTPITRTKHLAEIIHSVTPKPKIGQIDPATRSFQGIRIHINAELDEIQNGLDAAEKQLAPGGRLIVVSFHSLEDRIVKNFMIKRSKHAPKPSRHIPQPKTEAPTLHLPHRKPLKPSTPETNANPRARSARMRVAIKNTQTNKNTAPQKNETPQNETPKNETQS